VQGPGGRVDPALRSAPIEAEVRARIEPTPELLGRVRSARESLVALATERARTLGLPLVRALVAGSAARDTFLADRVDLDLFLLFPPDLPRADLEKHGLALARAILPEEELRYAEHPYLRGRYEGFAIDAVPGYAVTDPSKPLSAVDRTPFHHEWLSRRLTYELVQEVRLTKQFLRAQGIYGSEARTQGLSGYGVELLIVHFGSFRALLSQARSWRAPTRIIFTAGSEPRVPDDVALIMDDPVDPHRNVTSALAPRSFATLVLAAHAYLSDPAPRFFDALPPARLDRGEAVQRLSKRGTTVVGLRLPRPPFVDDIVCPQLMRAERVIGEEAERLGFRVLGTSSNASAKEVLVLLEAEPAELPPVRLHGGPPPGIDRVDSFLEKWTAPSAPVFQGPYIDREGRLAVDAERSERRLEQALTSSLPRLSLGRDLVEHRPKDAAFQPLAELTNGPDLELALGALLDRSLPWLRPLPP
jgi:tRNA nucleotidyltransferase (CCA-adding enzyme)